MRSDLPIKDSVYTIDNYADKQVQISGFRRFSKSHDLTNNNKNYLVTIPIEDEKRPMEAPPKPKFSFKRLFCCCCGKGDSESGGEVIN